jgi:hypothetical protein
VKRRSSAACIAIALSATVYALIVRPWHLRWGASDDEVGADFPGDNLIDHADLVATRAISVRATAGEVWPWIAQLGQGRGGFYTYDFLENLVGCDIHSADHVVPQWQQIGPGDAVKLHPDVALAVVVVDPGRALVLRGGVPMGATPPPYDFTWGFVLAERAGGGTRLVLRERYGYTRPWAPLLVEPVEVVSFVMSQRMMRGIRNLAERSLAKDQRHELATPGRDHTRRR